MKRTFLFTGLALLLSLSLIHLSRAGNAALASLSPTMTPTSQPAMVGTPIPYAGWELVWSDEFNAEAGAPIDDSYWTCETGGHGWGNAQLEYDTDRIENAAHDGAGNLVITAREEDYLGRKYTSARCHTRGKAEFAYGKIEARIDLPKGQGIWPAFWMLGANYSEAGWPNAGEIDIMEYIGREPRTVYGTVHGPGYSGADGINRAHRPGMAVAEDYHIFGIEWEPEIIRWYFDDELFSTVTPEDLGNREWVFDHPFYLIINVAVGGYWPGNPNNTSVFPQEMLIDWIRVYQRAEDRR